MSFGCAKITVLPHQKLVAVLQLAAMAQRDSDTAISNNERAFIIEVSAVTMLKSSCRSMTSDQASGTTRRPLRRYTV